MAYYFRWNPFLGHSSLLLVEFSIGIIIFEYYKRTKVSGFLIRLIIPLFSFILLASLFLYIDRVKFSKFFLAGLVVYVFILLEDIFTKDFKLFKFLKVLGDHSYSTYLNHTIIIG
jgi:peptidoglycan/LPS O-acetylase OafA/YrhL